MPTASFRLAGLAVVLAICATTGLAQTAIKLPKNKFTPEQDVEIGREAAAEVRKQYPIINDERIAGYLTTLGDRLVAAAPPELKQPVYEYSFTPVNLKEINAFALPGGPMFVHRGMFDAAATEGEVAGVMAHELSHVLLRHGTANATKAQNPWLQLGQIAGAVGGAVVGGGAGSADRAEQPVRSGHAAAALQPRLREAGGSARRADHGARRLRPARARAHVRDDRARVEELGKQRAAVDEQPSRPGQPHAVHQQGGGRADGRSRSGHRAVRADQDGVCGAATSKDERGTGASRR